MAEIVNLRRIRKRLAREKDARQAEENRFVHGRSRSERQHSELEKARLERGLDHARLESNVSEQAGPKQASLDSLSLGSAATSVLLPVGKRLRSEDSPKADEVREEQHKDRSK